MPFPRPFSLRDSALMSQQQRHGLERRELRVVEKSLPAVAHDCLPSGDLPDISA